MTSMTVTGSGFDRPARALACQSVGGCSAGMVATSISVVALLVAASLFCVWCRTEVVKQGYALSGLNSEIKRLEAEGEMLRAKAAGLRSPERIEYLAVERLGMQYPKREQIMVMEVGEDPVLGDLVGRGKKGGQSGDS